MLPKAAVASLGATLAAVLIVSALLAIGTVGATPPRPAAPTVVGPRRTTLQRPVFHFRAARAVAFRCAFDSTRLHRCAARFSQRLAPGRHVLRARSVGRSGVRSRVVTVTVRVVQRLPALAIGTPLVVGPGPGVPAVVDGSVWIPTTEDGGLIRVAGGASVSRTQVGPRSLGGEGYLDAAAAGRDAIWAASDIGSTIVRIDPGSGTVTQTLAVAERPGGLTVGAGAIWAFHFLQPAITRIDETHVTARRIDVPDVRAAGLAFGEGSIWLLSVNPNRLVELDLAGAVLRSIPLRPTSSRRASLIDAWWLAYGNGAVWATLPNYHAVARIDTATGAVRYVSLDQGQPFGISVGGGSAWVATDRAIVRLDGATGTPVAASSLPRAESSAFVSVAYGDGAAWVTNYDRDTVVRVDDPASPP